MKPLHVNVPIALNEFDIPVLQLICEKFGNSGPRKDNYRLVVHRLKKVDSHRPTVTKKL